MKYLPFCCLIVLAFFSNQKTLQAQDCAPVIEYINSYCELNTAYLEILVYSPDGSSDGSFHFGWFSQNGNPFGETYPYGQQVTISPPASDYLDLNIIDALDTSCVQNVFLDYPCEPCEIVASYELLECYDNGTLNDPTDDFNSVVINVANTANTASIGYFIEYNGATYGFFNYGEAGVIELFPDANNIAILNIYDEYDLDCFYTLTIPLEPCSDCAIEIFSNAIANCPENSANSPGSCEKVCANATVTYAANTFGLNNNVVWDVQGAASYTVEGPNLIVEWGEPGSGQITASYEDETSVENGFSVTCDELESSGFGVGMGYVSVQGDSGPFEISVSTDGMTVDTFFLPESGTVQVEGFGGFYDVLVTDSNGNSATCQFYINFIDDTCFVEVIDSIQNASACNNCDGWAALYQIDNAGQYIFEWSDGTAAYENFDLCAGDYFVTITNLQGQCQIIEKVSITCPAEIDPSVCQASQSLCVDIIENAKALLSSTPPPVNGVVSICAGQEVYFENQSENAEYFIWDFGTDESFTGTNVSFVYNNPGTYVVSLIAQNECFCSDTTQVTVEVGTSLTPDVGCTGTICAGESVTYTADAQCGTYNWNVSNGLITDGGGAADDFVTVDWGDGPVGIIELTVSGCAADFCPDPVIHQIPIISDAVSIQGPQKVCKGDIVNYTVPDFGGTSFVWSVSAQGIIEDGQGTSSITVHWNDNANPSQQWVQVEFGNCYLDCGGEETLLVNIAGEFYASGPIEVCINEAATYEAFKSNNSSPAPCNWSVFAADGSLYWSSATGSNTASFTWPATPGIYTIEADIVDVNNFCVEKYTAFTEVVDAPEPPTGINGETTICPGQGYSYTATAATFTTKFNWYITDGATTYETSGNPVNIVWGNAPPYEIQVSQVSNSGLPCESETISRTVTPLGGFSISGPNAICLENTSSYSTSFYENIDYNWSVMPPDAGTIISGQHTENIEVLWTKPGSAQLMLNRCNDVANNIITVNDLPQPQVNAPAGLCPGELANVLTTIPFASYEWRNEAGTIVSTDPNPNLPPGFYDLIATDFNGCSGNALFDIVEFPIPEVRISTPGNTGYCPGDQPPTLYGLETGDGYTYQWYRDSVAVPNTSSQMVADVYGYYHLEVTDVNGCSKISNVINIFEWCTPIIICTGGTCNLPSHDLCPVVTLMNYNANAPNSCNEFSFANNSPTAQPGSISWNFDDPNSPNNTSTLENPDHVYNEAGYYVPYIEGNMPSLVNPAAWCPSWYAEAISVPAAAYFDVLEACVGEPAIFTDNSTFIPATNIAAWSWDFGDPASGTDNVSNMQNPQHIYQNPGSYTINLTITHQDGCTATTSNEVTIHALPTVNFLPPSLGCEQVALEFIAQSTDEIAEYEWNFGDPASGAANSATNPNTFHEFSAPGLFPVSLKVTNIYGCQNTFNQVVEIEANNLSGSIDYVSPICEGETSNLIAPSGGNAWEWSDGSSNSTITTMEAGVYSVTVYDDQGCEYRPAQAILDVIPAPSGSIRAIDYNEYAQPVDYHYNSYGTCEGEDVHLEVIENPAYDYAWSNGSNLSEISFSEERENLLSQGIHEFSVTLTDTQSGCTAVEGPFTVSIYALPDAPVLASNPAGTVCNGEAAIISIQNPMADHVYFWSNGATGQSISTNTPGVYSVVVQDLNGCENKSNEVEIFEGPQVIKIPEGCHTRCNPDTLCMPDIPDIASWQWYFNDAPLGTPTANSSDLIIEESGDYYAVLTDNFGCTATSGTLSIDVLEAFGTINGQVYFDENNNGIIDPGDSLMEDVVIELGDGSTVLQTGSSGNNGSYAFNDIPSVNYTLSIDQTSLPPGHVPYEPIQFSVLEGCDDEEELLWLVHINCVTSSGTETLFDCPGEMVEYNGNFYETGTTQDVILVNSIGCDSIVSLTVNAFQIFNTPLEFEACAGTDYDYNGTLIPAGASQNFNFTDSNGCDSLVSVTINELLPTSGILQIDTCGVESIFYEGVEILVDTPTDVTITNLAGCDSIVTVSLNTLPPVPEILEVSSCENQPYLYNNVAIDPGTQMDFPLIASNGCDSVLTVVVNPIEVYNTVFNEAVCEGEVFLFANTPIPAGTQMDFPFTSSEGCDSIVTIAVAALEPTSFTMPIDTCAGGSFTYNGVTIFPGEEETFLLTNTQGCDSLLTIQVNELPGSLDEKEIPVCPGDMAVFDNIEYPAGTDTTFYFVDQHGCDSIIHLTVIGLPEMDYRLESERTCWNSNDGIISVEALSGGTPPFEYSLDGEYYIAENIFHNLLSGTYPVYVKDAQGCIMLQEIDIPEIEPITVAYDPPVLPCEADSIKVEVQLTSTSNTQISWLWENGYDRNFTFVNQPGTYLLEITNECETKVEPVVVGLETDAREEIIYIPNAFSPNDDGINDYFLCAPARDAEILNFEMHLFDRWGAPLFVSHDYTKGWDGTFQEEDLNPGVYVYWIKANVLVCKRQIEIFRKGDITILR